LAGSSLLALIDDIATLLDDVSVMTKVAAKKTAAVLGDDLALNAKQVSGVRADRELPVVWAVFKGSVLNKLVLVPAALLISAFAPWLITPLLMLGGAFLCYEGFEKVAEKLWHSNAEDVERRKERLSAVMDPEVDMAAFEKERIRGAIRTDAILSAEIIVIALGAVRDAELAVRIGTVTAIAALMTVGVYGLVAAIVKLDDAGIYLANKEAQTRLGDMQRRFGAFILRLAPVLMKALGIAGTAAMFLVGGGIIVHGLPPLADLLHVVEDFGREAGGGALAVAAAMTVNGIAGLIAGGLLVAAKELFARFRPGSAEGAAHD